MGAVVLVEFIYSRNEKLQNFLSVIFFPTQVPVCSPTNIKIKPPQQTGGENEVAPVINRGVLPPPLCTHPRCLELGLGEENVFPFLAV